MARGRGDVVGMMTNLLMNKRSKREWREALVSYRIGHTTMEGDLLWYSKRDGNENGLHNHWDDVIRWSHLFDKLMPRPKRMS